ncbi:MAG: flavin reductase family protein [Thermoprotei archaeon]
MDSSHTFRVMDQNVYRSIMRRFASGVAVVTTAGNGWIHGSTAQAFLSVSLNPPLVLVSLSLTGRTYTRIRESGSFAVNILSEEQRWVAERFADPKLNSEERFRGVRFARGVTGSPVIEGVCGYVEAALHNVFEVVDHALVLGRVVGGGESPTQVGPLVYYDRGYRSLRFESDGKDSSHQ